MADNPLFVSRFRLADDITQAFPILNFDCCLSRHEYSMLKRNTFRLITFRFKVYSCFKVDIFTCLPVQRQDFSEIIPNMRSCFFFATPLSIKPHRKITDLMPLTDEVKKSLCVCALM